MEEKENTGESGNKYLYVGIFLGVLVLAGAVYVFVSNKNVQPVSSPLPTASLSATIKPAQTQSASPSGEAVMGEATTMEDGLRIEDEVVGTGDAAVAGKSVTVNYLGTLTDGTKFDSSYDRNQPFTFNLGAGEVIKGWDEGVAGMKVGGKRKLTIPPTLGYGSQDLGAIPPNSTLIFEVELLKVQ